MNTTPLDITRASLDGAEDYRIIARAIVELSSGLSSRWQLGTRNPEDASWNPIQASSIQSLYRRALASAVTAFLHREAAIGRAWPDISAYVGAASDEVERTTRLNYMKLLAWHQLKGVLLEAICLLAVLVRYSPADPDAPLDLFASQGPVGLLGPRSREWLWTRPRIQSTMSDLGAVPDIVLASDDDRPSRSNIVSITECKCLRSIKASDLRAEFGKAFDLAVANYTIVSYHQPGPHIVRAAASMGLEFQVFQLGAETRSDYVSGKRLLEDDFVAELAESHRRRGFLAKVDTIQAGISNKLAILDQ
jgi:hypothetical protein